MFCTNCGAELQENANFCTVCGHSVEDGAEPAQPASTPSSEQNEPEDQPKSEDELDSASSAEPATESEPKESAQRVSTDDAAAVHEPMSAPVVSSGSIKKKFPLVVGIVLAVCIAVAVVAFVVLHSTGTQKAEFGQSVEVELNINTVVNPYDKDGQAMSSYDAYLIQRDADSDTASVDTTPYRVSISDEHGFNLSDFSDLSDGAYTLVIVNHGDGSSDTQQEIPVNYGKDNKQANSGLRIDAPSTDSTASSTDSSTDSSDVSANQQKAYALYLAKIREYTDLYGSCGSTVCDEYFDLATGLCVADLLDFNADGIDELVLIYNTEIVDSHSNNRADDQAAAMKAEVWAYKDGAICKVSDKSFYSIGNGGSVTAHIVEKDNVPYLMSVLPDETGSYVSNYYAFDGSEFNLVTSASFSDSVDNFGACTIDGKDVEYQEYSDLCASFTYKKIYDLLYFKDVSAIDVSYDYYLVGDLPYLVASTTQKLKSVTDKNASGSMSNTSAETDYASTEIEATVSVPDAQQISVGVDTDDAYDTTWSYVQFAYKDGTSNKVLDTLNQKLKSEFEADVDETTSWSYGDEGQIMLRTDKVASIMGDIACVFQGRYQTNGGAHGWDSSEAVYYDLSSGEEVVAPEALGVSESMLQKYAVAGINAFLESNPSDIGAQDLSSIVTDMTRYVRDEKGIFFCTRSYELGSYAFGSHRIYIASNSGDDSIVGTECTISNIS